MAKKIKIINKCLTTYENIEFYVNGNQTHFICYNTKLNKLEKIQESEWRSSEINCLVQVVDKDNDDNFETIKKYSIRDLISEDVAFIRTVVTISSTTKPIAYFSEKSGVSQIEKHKFNEFFKAKEFSDAKINNKYSEHSNILKLLKTETPTFYILIKNLFFKESEEVILNFINWLSAAAYKDKHQSEYYCFIGKNEKDQGQGAGKGVLQSFLNELFSGLVAKESSTSFKKEFNPHLENKKIVIFDELNFKTWDYNKFKDITGCATLSVEAKGKSTYEAKNVSSWCLFTNEHDLKDKITYADRRAFIIRPNPINNSLKRIMNSKFDGHTNFETLLHADIANVIQILGKCSNNTVLDPVQLITNAKRDYFKERSVIGIEQIDDFSKILINKNLKKKVTELLRDYKPENFEVVIKLLQNDCMNKKTFNILLNNLVKMGFIKKPELNKEWEKLKEMTLKHDFIITKVDFKNTQKFTRFLDRTLLVPKSYGKPKLKPIKSYLREFFGKKVPPSSSLDQNPTVVAIAPMILDGLTQPECTNNPQVNN